MKKYMVLKRGYLYKFNRKYKRIVNSQTIFYWSCQKYCKV